MAEKKRSISLGSNMKEGAALMFSKKFTAPQDDSSKLRQPEPVKK